MDWCRNGPVHWIDEVSGNGYVIGTYVWPLFCPESGQNSAFCIPRMGLEVEDTMGHINDIVSRKEVVHPFEFTPGVP